jgi:hypothetical protein
MEPVKLSDFITQSLVEIYQGIKGANKTIGGRITYSLSGKHMGQRVLTVTAFSLILP